MGPASTSAADPSSIRWLRWSGWLLLALGLIGHVYAAWAMGGSWTAYWHHTLGFAFILLVTGGLLAGLGHWLWRAHSARTFFAIGLVQAVLGLMVALDQYRAAGGG